MGGPDGQEEEWGSRGSVAGDLGTSGGQRAVGARVLCGGGYFRGAFYAWRKRLRTRKVEGRREESSDNARLFIPLKVLDTAATLEIVHPLGYRIQVTGDVNPVALRHVIETLDERAAR
jgi:hypothetical protein